MALGCETRKVDAVMDVNLENDGGLVTTCYLCGVTAGDLYLCKVCRQWLCEDCFNAIATQEEES